jgi:MOSC domain-containing protein YiiM
MHLISVNVGRPREVEFHGRTVVTSIFKSAVAGSVHVSPTNVDGDQQSDLTVHGGHAKAVYGYPSEHYAFWKRELGVEELPWGAFGENLTTEGLLERTLRIGDRLRVGTVELEVTQPRYPCFKLGVRFGRDDMVKLFSKSGRSGFYFSVVREGIIQAGDRVEMISRLSRSETIAERFAEHFRKREGSVT